MLPLLHRIRLAIKAKLFPRNSVVQAYIALFALHDASIELLAGSPKSSPLHLSELLIQAKTQLSELGIQPAAPFPSISWLWQLGQNSQRPSLTKASLHHRLHTEPATELAIQQVKSYIREALQQLPQE